MSHRLARTHKHTQLHTHTKTQTHKMHATPCSQYRQRTNQPKRTHDSHTGAASRRRRVYKRCKVERPRVSNGRLYTLGAQICHTMHHTQSLYSLEHVSDDDDDDDHGHDVSNSTCAAGSLPDGGRGDEVTNTRNAPRC